jgi:hypothetical protein
MEVPDLLHLKTVRMEACFGEMAGMATALQKEMAAMEETVDCLVVMEETAEMVE